MLGQLPAITIPIATPTAIRILIADDHALMRHGLRSLLVESGGFEVLGEAGDGRQAARLATALRPDVVLMDVEMPGISVLEALRQIRRVAPASKVLLLGTRANESRLFEYLTAGASGFLLKEGTGAELICALRDVHQAEFYISSSVSRKVLEKWHRGAVKPRRGQAARSAGDDPLSEREREMLEYIATGLANRQIAERLCISVKTVEAHKSHMVAKLGLRGSNDLVRVALQRRWPIQVTSA